MPFFSFFQRDVLLARQNNGTECETEIGWGTCKSGGCPGLSSSKGCSGKDLECCLLRECQVPEGSGYCRSKERNGCADGQFFPGTGKPWPCPGGNDTVCCVKFKDFINSTSTSTTTSLTSPSTTGPTTTSTSYSPTPIASDSTDSGTAMGGGQIAGAVVGSVSGVAILAITGIFLYMRRRKAKQATISNESGDESGNENERAEMPDSAGMRVRPVGAIAPGRGDLVEAPSDVASDRDEKKNPEDLLTVFNPPRELDSSPLTPVELDSSPIATEDDKARNL